MPKRANKPQNILYFSMALNVLLAAIVLVLAVAFLYQGQHTITVASNTPTNATANQITTTLAGIDQPLNATQLSVINNAPLSFYETAGERLLNGTLTNQVYPQNTPQYNALIINGKPTVVYVGASTCPFCAENRWAMALALSQFGKFDKLYLGYSALQDGDVPTVYWTWINTTTNADVMNGAYFTSNTINFIAAEYESPITGHFQVQPISYFLSKSPNSTYTQALAFMNQTNKFQGTPFTLWGTSLNGGADAVVVGNSLSGGWSQISAMTHAQIFSLLANGNSQFAWGQYAAADVYIAEVCPSVNNTAPVCALPAIKQIGAIMGLSS